MHHRIKLFACIFRNKSSNRGTIYPKCIQKCRMTDLQWQSALYDLRRQIVAGDLPGGTKLRASHLAVQMDISRTPISEALVKLEGEGLLVRDKSGYTVRTFDLQEVYDAIELRGLLEGAAVRKAAERGVSEVELQKLNELLQALDDVLTRDQLADYDALNHDFHLQLAQASNSDILVAEVKRSYRFPFAAPSAFPTHAGDAKRFRASLAIGQHHHQQILLAITRREGTRAAALMSEHALLAHENVLVATQKQEAIPQLALVRTPV